MAGAPAAKNYWNGNQFVIPPVSALPTLQQILYSIGVGTPESLGVPMFEQHLDGEANGSPGTETGPTSGTTVDADGNIGVAEGGRSWSSPRNELNAANNYGMLGTVAGTLMGVPGLGMAGGAYGGYKDAQVANDILDKAYGLPAAVNPTQSAMHGLSSLPFGIGSLFGKSAFDQLAEEAGRGYSMKEGFFSDAYFDTVRAAEEAKNPTTPTAPVEAVTREALADLATGGSSGGNGTGGGPSGGPGGEGMGNGGNAWAKGGPVTRERLIGPDPEGPDEGYGALMGGEHVIRKSSAKYYGKALMRAINEQQIPRERLLRLLAG